MVESFKTRVWKGRQQAYIQNPNTVKYGWYNTESQYMTEYGKSVQATITSFDTDEKYFDYMNESSTDSFDYDHYMKWEADTKEGIAAYKEGASATARGERSEILTALEALARF